MKAYADPGTSSVCVASIVVLVESARFDPYHEELPLNVAPIMMWATVEINFAIVSGKSALSRIFGTPIDVFLQACLPMMRPIMRRILPGSVLGSNPSKGFSGPGTHGTNKGAIKLTTITNVKDADEASSTRQLADNDAERGSNHSSDELHNGSDYHGNQTFVSGMPHRNSSTQRDEEPLRIGNGIHVKNEMSVSYERM